MVKESIPLMFLAIADIISSYFIFTPEKKQLEKEIFNALYELCTENNSAKGQVFKGDSLKHLTNLVNRENLACFSFLNRICDSDDNIAIFLGRGFFTEIIHVYKKFQVKVLDDYAHAAKHMDDSNDDILDRPIDSNIDVDDWILYIILNNLFSKLLTKKFIDETSKL